MIGLRPKFRFPSQILAILLGFGPFWLYLGHTAWIWAIWQSRWTDGRMDGQIFLCSTGLCLLRGRCPKKWSLNLLIFHPTIPLELAGKLIFDFLQLFHECLKCLFHCIHEEILHFNGSEGIQKLEIFVHICNFCHWGINFDPKDQQPVWNLVFCFLQLFHECLRCLFHCKQGDFQHYGSSKRNLWIQNFCSFSWMFAKIKQETTTLTLQNPQNWLEIRFSVFWSIFRRV